MISRGGKQTKGFTLIEVLVAVAIIGFVVPALMLLMMQQTDYAGVLRDKTMAAWIAENKATELRLARVFSNQLLDRETTEKVEMAGAEWEVAIDIENTGGPLLIYRIKVSRDTGITKVKEPLVTLEMMLNVL